MRVLPARESGVALIEVVIVLIISATMMAVAMSSRESNGTSATRAGAISAARALGDAVNDFRKDHGGRSPALGTADWPTGTVAQRNRGPINTYTGRPYLRGKALDVLSSDIARVVGPGGTAPDPVRFVLQLSTAGGRPGGWAIVVRDKRAKAPPCHITGGAIAIPSGAGTPC